MADAPSRLAACLAGPRDAPAIAALSCAALDRALRAPAELTVAIATGDAVLAGAFQRVTTAVGGLASTDDARAAGDAPVFRRGSGGPAVRVGPGTVHVALALASPSALVACDEKRIVNRYVRPILRALTRCGHTASFTGRDWIAVAHRPAGWVGFAHDAASRRTLVEAFVAVRTPFADAGRASFLGKHPATLEELAGKPVDEARIARAIVDAYAGDAPPGDLAWPGSPDAPPIVLAAAPVTVEPPWLATVDEAIGPLGAGPDASGTFRVGGDLLVSRDALALLEARAATAPLDDLPALVDATLGARGVALDGVKSLTSLLDVITRARRRG
jgi:hypothetical protein